MKSNRLSSNDIDKGARWATDIAANLEESRVGIICLTPENLESPWILFEAGALSKTINQTFVCPYLIGLEPTDIKGPLVQFQAAKANKEDTKRLIQTVNRAQGEVALPESRLDAAFEKWWQDLEQQLRNLPPPETEIAFQRSEKDMLRELLTIARHFQQRERSAANDAKKMIEQAINELTRQLRSLVRR